MIPMLDPLPPGMASSFALLSAASGSLTPVQTLTTLLVMLSLLAIPAFGFGILAGWFRWSFLASRSLAKLERQNAELRAQLHGSASPAKTA